MSDLQPYTMYSFRMRAKSEQGFSSWSENTEPIRTLHRLGLNGYIPLDLNTDGSTALLHNENKELVWMESGEIHMPGNSIDTDYAHGIGVGGSEGGDGGDGLVVLSVYVSGQSEPSRSFYFNTGVNEVFVVPSSTVNGIQVSSVVARLWGAGGGAGSSSLTFGNGSSTGGGGAFVEIKLSVKQGDHIKVKVGSGGKGVKQMNNGGSAVFGGGGEGGYGDEGGGGSGGGATSIYMISSSYHNEPHTLIAIAAGGGGGGTSHICCSSGGPGAAAVNTKSMVGNGQSPTSTSTSVNGIDGESAASSGGLAGEIDEGGAAGVSGYLGVSISFCLVVFMLVCLYVLLFSAPSSLLPHICISLLSYISM